ncbi:Predicted PurR-regulated permease PerM [Propionibacterium cyclohexanicum]|uniref:Predicted PurR-regulated permease PerM n=1 Tax=Propionibacterium cyclohexanicum TaxID=64702 RepID=A0A1H9SBK5_9ACTN|nr:AI-2E family transporter [Propionibacterium cyclohexanicum]SER82392.1 Predicted PurR-regulated permease PerM [Propionibacterium cyclohexanicum]
MSPMPPSEPAETPESLSSRAPVVQGGSGTATPAPASALTSPDAPGFPRFLKVALGIVLVLAALLMLREFATTFAPIFLALNLMVTAYPLHTWLVKRHCPSPISATIVALVVLVVLFTFFVGLAWAVGETISLLPTYGNEFSQIYQQVIDLAARLGFDEQQILSSLKSIDPNSIMSAATSLLSGASGFLGIMAVLVTTIFFMAMDTPGFAARFRIAESGHSRITAGFSSFSRGVRRYWIVTTVFGLIVAVLDTIAVAILGVPLPVVWGLLSFITNYIPNIGFIIGLIPPALVALVALGWKQALVVVVLYCVLNFVVQSLIQPRFTGQSVGVTPTVSFVSLLVWGSVLGALGTLLALPMTLLLKALIIDTDPRARWVNALLASDPGDAEDEPAVS